MSLDYSPELRRQHEAYKAVRERIAKAAKPQVKPQTIKAMVAVVEKPVETVESKSVFTERDWLVVTPPAGIGEISKEVCKQFGIRRMDFESHRRTGEVVTPRQIAMSLAKHLTRKSLPEIGRMIGKRDHTTVLYACRRWKPVIDAVALRLSADHPISEWVSAIREQSAITPLAWGRKYTRKTV